MQIIIRIFEEGKVIGGLYGKCERLGAFVIPCDVVHVEVRERAEENLVFTLRRQEV